MKRTLHCGLLLAALSTASLAVQAGVYADDLSRCLVEASSDQDRTALVRWMFTSIALHPAAQGLAQVSKADFDAANKAAADLITRLMTETCHAQAKKAVKYEGPVAIQQGFQVFGQVAGQEIFAHPDVAGALAGLEQHLDADKLQAAFQDN